MIPASRVLVWTQPVDMRKSYDGLAGVVRAELGMEPLEVRALFVFVNRRNNRAKVLWWTETGFCILCKRLHGALFRWPGRDDGAVEINFERLKTLLAGEVKMAR